MSALTRSEVIDELHRLMLRRYGPWFAGRVRERMHDGVLLPDDVGWVLSNDLRRRGGFWGKLGLGAHSLALLVFVIEYLAGLDPYVSRTLPGSVVVAWAMAIGTAAFGAAYRDSTQDGRALKLMKAAPSGWWSAERVATPGPGTFVYGDAALLLEQETPQAVAEGAYMDDRSRAERISTGLQTIVQGLSALGVATVLWAGVETASSWTWTWFLCTGVIGSVAVDVMWTFVVKRRRDDLLFEAVLDPSTWSGGLRKGHR